MNGHSSFDMSLKNFHVLFISLCVLLALFCAVWAFGVYRSDGSPAWAAASVGTLLIGAALVQYERTFLRRCRALGIR